MKKIALLLALMPALQACTIQQVDYISHDPDPYRYGPPNVEVIVPERNYERPRWQRHHHRHRNRQPVVVVRPDVPSSPPVVRPYPRPSQPTIQPVPNPVNPPQIPTSDAPRPAHGHSQAKVPVQAQAPVIEPVNNNTPAHAHGHG